ncbi:MAG TPA: DUF3247 family protein [Xanthomonadaceae bacterium]|nr:DUF3247 family protein [Xanthomonadaceae bacterium]
MTRVAPRVHIRNEEIALLEAIALQLPQNERVQLRLADGRELTGTVTQMPTVQSFFDPEGREGTNAILRLDTFLDDGRPHDGGRYDIWLDDIDGVTRVPDPSPPEPSARIAPPDPNAPTPVP